jgi:hypothetical protein
MSYGHPEPVCPGRYINCAQTARVAVDVRVMETVVVPDTEETENQHSAY